MVSALLTFLMSSGFRMVWGEVADWLKSRQDHKQEIELMRLQAELEAAQFERQQLAIKAQADLQIKTIQVKGESDLSLENARGWNLAVENAMKPTGIRWVDAWNGAIRPMCASIAIILWVFALNKNGYIMTDYDRELVSGILGFFFADRALAKRGK